MFQICQHFKTSIHSMNILIIMFMFCSKNPMHWWNNWSFSGYGGPCCNWITDKPGVNKGDQTIMLYNFGHHYSQLHLHWHSQVKKDTCVTAQCANETHKPIQRVGMLLKLSLPAANEEVDVDNVAFKIPTIELANKQLQ